MAHLYSLHGIYRGDRQVSSLTTNLLFASIYDITHYSSISVELDHPCTPEPPLRALLWYAKGEIKYLTPIMELLLAAKPRRSRDPPVYHILSTKTLNFIRLSRQSLVRLNILRNRVVYAEGFSQNSLRQKS